MKTLYHFDAYFLSWHGNSVLGSAMDEDTDGGMPFIPPFSGTRRVHVLI